MSSHENNLEWRTDPIRVKSVTELIGAANRLGLPLCEVLNSGVVVLEEIDHKLALNRQAEARRRHEFASGLLALMMETSDNTVLSRHSVEQPLHENAETDTQ